MPILTDHVPITPNFVVSDWLQPHFRECTPKILLVTDGLFFDTTDFGLSDFIDALQAATIHGMHPIVETALHGQNGPADHPNFVFTSASFSKSKYDVLFLFGVRGAGQLDPAERAVIEAFMDAGGGVFGTGGHATLGLRLCGQIKRLSEMRRWNGPSASTSDRISTNDPGLNNSFEFADQSDAIPQKIYPAYFGSPASSAPHALLQHPTKQVIEVLPDHPHESECWVPADVSDHSVWPADAGGNDVSPIVVAQSMSYGGGFPFPVKAPISEPRSFGAIGAYDGQSTEAGVGRIVVDATWHHFININLIASPDGVGLVPNADAYERIHQYFVNIADWLMPAQVRYCLRYAVLLDVARYYPVAEFIWDRQSEDVDFGGALEVGRELRSTLRRFMTLAQVDQFERDLIELANPKLRRQLDMARSSPKDVGVIERTANVDDVACCVAGGTAVLAVASMMQGDDSPDVAFKRVDGTSGLEKLVKQQINERFAEFGKLLARKRDDLNEIIEMTQ